MGKTEVYCSGGKDSEEREGWSSPSSLLLFCVLRGLLLLYPVLFYLLVNDGRGVSCSSGRRSRSSLDHTTVCVVCAELIGVGRTINLDSAPCRLFALVLRLRDMM